MSWKSRGKRAHYQIVISWRVGFSPSFEGFSRWVGWFSSQGYKPAADEGKQWRSRLGKRTEAAINNRRFFQILGFICEKNWDCTPIYLLCHRVVISQNAIVFITGLCNLRMERTRMRRLLITTIFHINYPQQTLMCSVGLSACTLE